MKVTSRTAKVIVPIVCRYHAMPRAFTLGFRFSIQYIWAVSMINLTHLQINLTHVHTKKCTLLFRCMSERKFVVKDISPKEISIARKQN